MVASRRGFRFYGLVSFRLSSFRLCAMRSSSVELSSAVYPVDHGRFYSMQYDIGWTHVQKATP